MAKSLYLNSNQAPKRTRIVLYRILTEHQSRSPFFSGINRKLQLPITHGLSDNKRRGGKKYRVVTVTGVVSQSQQKVM